MESFGTLLKYNGSSIDATALGTEESAHDPKTVIREMSSADPDALDASTSAHEAIDLWIGVESDEATGGSVSAPRH